MFPGVENIPLCIPYLECNSPVCKEGQKQRIHCSTHKTQLHAKRSFELTKKMTNWIDAQFSLSFQQITVTHLEII